MRIHALLFFFICAASGGQSAFALYGGRPVASEKHLVTLQVGEEVFCQGVVIARNKVLTAGHCIEGMGVRLKENPHILTYYPDTVVVKSGSQMVRAVSITYAPTMFDAPDISAEDLAVIELAKPLTNAEVLPFALKTDLSKGKAVILSSNGQEAIVTVRATVQGDDSFVVITDGSKSGVCQGDSGGALLIVKGGKKYLAGVLAARANGCARKHSVSYFPRRIF